MDRPTAINLPPVVQSLLQGIQHKAGMRSPADPLAQDVAGVDVDHERDINEPCLGRDIGEVRDPQSVGCRRVELAVDVIQRARCRPVTGRGAHRLATDHACQAEITHQPPHRAAGNAVPLTLHLPPDFAHALNCKVIGEHPGDLWLEGEITLCPRRQAGWILSLRNMLVICGRGDRQNITDQLDPMIPAVIVDKRDHRLNGLASSAGAKYADALPRISLAWRSLRFSRSRALSRSASSVGTPVRLPLSTSAFFSYSSKVCAEQPNFSAIDVTAAQRGG
jgi:hypothetical protein